MQAATGPQSTGCNPATSQPCHAWKPPFPLRLLEMTANLGMKCLEHAIIIRARPPSSVQLTTSLSTTIISSNIIQNTFRVVSASKPHTRLPTIKCPTAAHQHTRLLLPTHNSLVYHSYYPHPQPQPPQISTIFRNGRLQQHVLPRAAPFSAASLPRPTSQPASASSAQVWLSDSQSRSIL